MATDLKSKISIIVITRNRANFISRAIQSVLDQSFSDWELIIIDDSSTDNTEEIVQSFVIKDSRIKYNKNSTLLGISANRNKGLFLTTGKYMAVLDSDDYWLDKDKLQKQYNFLENNPDFILIGSNVRIIDEKENFIKKTVWATEDSDIRKKILIKNFFKFTNRYFLKTCNNHTNSPNFHRNCVNNIKNFFKIFLNKVFFF